MTQTSFNMFYITVLDNSFLSFADIEIFIFLLFIVVFLRVSRART